MLVAKALGLQERLRVGVWPSLVNPAEDLKPASKAGGHPSRSVLLDRALVRRGEYPHCAALRPHRPGGEDTLADTQPSAVPI